MAKSLTEISSAPAIRLGPYRAADYMALPDEPRYELIYGRLYLLSSPILLHQIVTGALWSRLHEVAASAGGLALFAPMDVHLADHSVVQPDVIYLSPERLRLAEDWIMGAPDLLVEILSPSTARRDRGRKLRLYAESGVREYWLVDPVRQSVEFRANVTGRFVTVPPAGEQYRSPLLPDVRLDLAAFWRDVSEQLQRVLGNGEGRYGPQPD